jgi:hypothetical protein
VFEKPSAKNDEIEKYNAMLVMSAVKRDLIKYKLWYLVLVAAQQVRDLTDSNIENFRKMKNGRMLPSSVKKYLSYWASEQDSLVENRVVRERFKGNMFFEYHTTGCSTPDLCLKAMKDFPEKGFFTPADRVDVKHALKNRHKIDLARDIPQSLLVKVRLVLEATGCLPDTWYMGERAKNNCSGKKYSAGLKMIKAILDKRADIVDLENKSEEVIATSLKKLFADPKKKITVKKFNAKKSAATTGGNDDTNDDTDDDYGLGDFEDDDGNKKLKSVLSEDPDKKEDSEEQQKDYMSKVLPFGEVASVEIDLVREFREAYDNYKSEIVSEFCTEEKLDEMDEYIKQFKDSLGKLRSKNPNGMTASDFDRDKFDGFDDSGVQCIISAGNMLELFHGSDFEGFPKPDDDEDADEEDDDESSSEDDKEEEGESFKEETAKI